MASVWLWSYFCTFLPCNQQFASKFSYHCNSLIFQHYVKCDTSTPKCRKWRERCTGLNHDLAPFNGSQRCLQLHRISWWPCISDIVLLCMDVVTFVYVPGGQIRFGVVTIEHLLYYAMLWPGELGPVCLQLRGGQRGLLQAPDPGHVRDISHRCY